MHITSHVRTTHPSAYHITRPYIASLCISQHTYVYRIPLHITSRVRISHTSAYHITRLYISSLCISAACSSGQFPACWRQANVTPIPKGPPSFSVANYRPISITSVFSKVFERLVLVRLRRFLERSGVLPTTHLLIGKVWVPVMHFCACHIHCRVHWRVGRRLGSCRLTSVQPLHDRVNHLGILYKLCSVDIGGSVISIFFVFWKIS